MSLKVVDPIDVTEAIFTSSDIPEPDPAHGEVEWVDRSGVEQIYFNTGNQIESFVDTDTGFTYASGHFNSSSNSFMKIDKSDDSFTFFGAFENISRAGYYKKSTGIIYFGTNDSKVTAIDTSTDSITNHAVPFGNFADGAVSVSDEIIYLYGGGGADKLLKFDTSTNTGTVIGGFSEDLNSAIASEGGVIYFGGFNGGVYRLNTADDSVSLLATLPGRLLTAQIAGAGKIYFFSNLSRVLVKFDTANNTYENISSTKGGVYASDIAADGFIYYVSYVGSTISNLSRIDPSTDEIVDYGDYQGSFPRLVATDSEIGYIGDFFGFDKFRLSYLEGSQVVLSSEHRRYSAAASTIDNPVDGIAKTPPTWIDIGPTNKWAMFDKKTTRQTVSASDFSVTLDPVNQINTVAFLNLTGVTSIRIEVRDKDEVLVYDETFDLIDTTPIYDYYTFFFYQQSLLEQLVDDVIPAYYDPEIKVTFTGSDMSVGEIVAGFATQIGTTLSDTSSDTYDYSTQEFDEFGEINYVERPIVNLNTYEILSDKAHNPYIQRLVKKLRGKNALWIGNVGGGQKLITYGRYERSPIPFDMVDHVQYSITVRGSI